MKDGKISKLVMAIVSKDTSEVLERWQFDIQVFGQSLQTPHASRATEQEKENQKYPPMLPPGCSHAKFRSFCTAKGKDGDGDTC
jgi:hypothetical protein